MDDVNCIGTEYALSECTHYGWGNHNCGHGEDVGINCTHADLSTGSDMSEATATLRLEGIGSTASEGRLEILYENTWGTVCNDGFDKFDAEVVCRQLGFRSVVEIITDGAGSYGEGSGIIWLDEVACTGEENTIEECSSNGWGKTDCQHSEDIGIVCLDSTESYPVIHNTTDVTEFPEDYRIDGRCGPDFPGPNGEEGICLKDGEYPCCSTEGWCGITEEHCVTSVHRDYRKTKGILGVLKDLFSRDP